jgi:hypothetical protein
MFKRRSDHVKLLGFVMLLVLTGCSSDDDQTSGGDGGAQAAYVLCTEPAGSWTDTSDEDPDWRTGQPSIDWTDEAGCAIRLDHVWHNFGDDHCEWQDVEHISFGLPIGTPYTGPEANPPGQDWAPFFIFNTDGAVNGLPVGQELAASDVPATAIDTGLRTATGRSLFLAEDESVLYDIQGDNARLFVQISEDDYGCA